MKKFIATFLAILMILGAMPVMAFGADEPVIRVSSAQSNRGKDVSVTVNIENNPGIAGMTLAFDYDESVLNLTSIEKSELAGTWIIVENVVWANSDPLNNSYYNGVFVTLNFTVSETAALGESIVTVKYSEGDIVNCDFDDINFTVVPGSVTVACTSHNFNKEVVDEKYIATEATCTEPATYYYSCECGASSKGTSDEKVFAAGETVPHTFDKEEATEKYFVSGATCTEKAKYYKSCSVCGEKGTEIFEYGETLPHDFVKVADDKYLATEATCTEVATYYMSCSVCGEADSETFEHGEVLPHDFTAEVAESKYVVGEATCGEPATYYRSCSVCGESSNDENNTFANGEPLGHTWGETEYSWAADNSSCTATRVCTIETCGKEEVNTTNNVKVETTDATCSAEGKTVYTAEFVNDWAETQTKTVAIAINPEAHAWNKGEVTTEPTCSAMGVKTYICQHNAEHTKTEDIAINPDAHEWSVSYNWTDDGLACTATRACANNAEHNVVAEAEVTGVKTKEPTCSAMGDTQYTAKFAADWAETQVTTRTDVAINPDAHDWDAWKVTEYPTYGVAGKETRVCVINPEHKEYHELDALEMPKQEEADKVVIDEKEYFVGEEVIAPEETKDVPKEIVDETKLNKNKYKVSFVGVIIGAFDDAGEFTKEDVKGTVTIGFPEGADKNDKFEVYVIDAQGNVTKLAGADVTEAGIEVEVDGSATFAIAYESVSNHSGRPVRPSTGSGSADKDAEENPNTGAPFMGYVPVMVVAAAVAICKKRH